MSNLGAFFFVGGVEETRSVLVLGLLCVCARVIKGGYTTVVMCLLLSL
jgi:hypothetical protein